MLNLKERILNKQNEKYTNVIIRLEELMTYANERIEKSVSKNTYLFDQRLIFKIKHRRLFSKLKKALLKFPDDELSYMIIEFEIGEVKYRLKSFKLAQLEETYLFRISNHPNGYKYLEIQNETFAFFNKVSVSLLI